VVPQNSGIERNRHAAFFCAARGDLEYSGLVTQIAPEAFRVGEAVPGLDTEEIGARPGPKTKQGRVWKFHFDMGAGFRAITQTAAFQLVEYQRVMDEKFVAQGSVRPLTGVGKGAGCTSPLASSRRTGAGSSVSKVTACSSRGCP
jgi:hypothetical protein